MLGHEISKMQKNIKRNMRRKQRKRQNARERHEAQNEKKRERKKGETFRFRFFADVLFGRPLIVI